MITSGSEFVHSPDHEWLYFPDMTRDEILFFVFHDSDHSRAWRVLHSAFRDPTVEGAVPRHSIEVRRAGKPLGAGSAASPGGESATGGADDYLAERGYIEVVQDVRGSGDSNGSWGLFDPVQQRDAIKVLNWAGPFRTRRVETLR
jgi:X-Pro dipeptidyl-peptidase (S15 family)